MFQDPALFGHFSVGRNIAFPLEIRRQDAAEIRERVGAEVRALDIESLVLRDPMELSRGEQQIVQIARALVRVPKVLLLDEPFAALDEPRRDRLRAEVALLQAGYGVTTLMSTNDPPDVAALATSLVVLAAGRVVQVDRTVGGASVAGAPCSPRWRPVRWLCWTCVSWPTVGATGWSVTTPAAGGGAASERGLRRWRATWAQWCGSVYDPSDVVVAETGSLPAVVERAAVLHPGAVICLVAGQRVTAMVPSGEACAPGDQVRLRVDHHTVFDRVTDQSVYSWCQTPGVSIGGRSDPDRDQSTVQVPLERRSAARSPGPLRSLAAIT